VKINDAGLEIIKHYEGYSSSVYRCPASRLTIGWGSTWDHNGDPIREDQPDIDEEYAEKLLLREIHHTEHAIARLVKVGMTANSYSSLTSFIYNVGSGNFQSSTLRMKLNRGNYYGAADEFPKWRRGGGRILRGLVRRRKSERDLFLLDL